MKLELHILQNFAPSNLNRDDTGAPKDCSLGGYRRARISSQCQKRATRDLFSLQKMLPEENLATRTKRLAEKVAERLESEHGLERSEGLALAMGAIEGVGLRRASTKKSEDDTDAWKTEYLLFVPRRIIGALATLLHEHRDELSTLARAVAEGDAKKTKKAAKSDYPKEIRKQVEDLLASASACADLALFGRMIADAPAWNVEASCQVAHAVSTHSVEMDFDFYTAVDDFKPEDNAGSDMMGTVQFNSSCFYRYAVLDVDALAANLDDEPSLTRATQDAFVRAFVRAIPSGKQNSMAAHNPPSYVLAVARPSGQPVSLSNAFLRPARPRGGAVELDLVDDSIDKLEEYFARMSGWLGEETIALSLADRDLAPREGIERVVNVEEFFTRVAEATA
jgi:CRISPR system Cascade subunit CasC